MNPGGSRASPLAGQQIDLEPQKSNHNSVTTDTREDFIEAARQLCRLGYTDMRHMIAGTWRVSNSINLTDGAMTALKEFEITIPSEWFLDCGYSRERAYHAAGKLIDSGKQTEGLSGSGRQHGPGGA